MAASNPWETARTSWPRRCTGSTEAQARTIDLGSDAAAAPPSFQWCVARLTEDDSLADSLQDWRERLDTWNRRGDRIALWGSAERAYAVLVLFDRGDVFDSIVSDDTGFLARTATPLLPVRKLQEDPPDVVLNASDASIDTVRAALDAVGIAPRVYSL